MKHIYVFAALILTVAFAQAQNLVVNPSFETTASNCGNFGGEGFTTDLSASWNSANSNTAGDSCSSPDLFAPCNTIFGISVTGMPDNELGWQNARTGTRYVGIITHDPLSNYREYIQGRTSAPLVGGQTYCVSMFVSRGDNVPYATNNMGVYFTNTEYMRDACPNNSLINVVPQLNYSCSPITDTTNWVRLQWTYTAVGGERYFTIGNFYNNANTTIVNVGPSSLNPYAYYYIDDVSIVASGECCYASIAAVEPKCLSDAAITLNALPPIGTDCTPSVTGTWSGPGVNASTGLFTPSAAGVGTHTINFTLSCGYVATTSITVNACAQLNVCLETNGNVTVSGGSGNYTWESQSIEEDCSGCTFGNCNFCFGTIPTVTVWTSFSTSATATPPGTWPIRVTDGQGGIVTLNSTSGLVACEGAVGCTLALSVGNVVNACVGATGSATVSATGGVGTLAYSWNTNPVQTSATATGLAAGEYTVTVTDDNDCVETLTFAIQSGAIVANAGEDVVICKGEETTLVASGGDSYSWNNGLGNQAEVVASPTSNTTYTVQVSSGNCSDTDDVQVIVAQPITVTLGAPVTSFCENADAVQLQGSPAGGTYSGAGMNGDMFSPAQAGLGTHVIIYSVYEYEECPFTASASLTVDVCTGMDDADAFTTVVVYPNPTDGLVIIDLQEALESKLEITVFDAMGRTIAIPAQRGPNRSQYAVNLNGFSEGLYVIRIQTLEQQSRSFRVMKN